MVDGVSPDILQTLTSFGVGGVLLLWLWDVRAQLREERSQHDQTRRELKDALKDCHREDDTRRIPRIPESERLAFKQRLQEPP